MSALDVTVDYGAITHNVEVLRSRASGADVMAVVKADAYGHGLAAAAEAARRGGAAWLGVAQPGEALALRAAGDTGRILTWLYGPELPARELIIAEVDLSASSPDVLGAIVAAARDLGVAPRVHLCVDTGLGREGVPLRELGALLDLAVAAQAEGLVRIVGMWSHLAWADAPGHATIDAQATAFREALAMAQEREIALEVRHLANSACTLTRPDLHFDLVRPGIAVYGLPPVPDPAGERFGLRAAMAVRSEVILVKNVGAGQGVSYGHDYVTPYPTTLGLISAGYADGVFRRAGNRAEVSIRGRRFRIAGRVCMDQFVVDLGPVTDVVAGDVATLIGPDGPTATEWADAIETIDYEVVCRFGVLRRKGAA
ncbi:alanine racemase [Demequina sp. NBRC 110056]|uniref:alanine racemase n=1 Tax=Demequina sp. NBRC 110056 TaxID=1570345 RepID=UPI000A078770|nr:alanine racemase [Demequina sp. NBRC 110056]